MLTILDYNFVLNETPNNNDIMHVGNIMLNEVPNSSDAMRLVSNVHLTTISA